ncbi:MAG: DUF695 domain-containing protein [Tepidisphaerales bacterium]
MSDGPRWVVFVGESEGMPLLVKLDGRFGAGYRDVQRPWAVTVRCALDRIDGNGLPPEADFPMWEAVEAAVDEAIGDGEGGIAVARLYGEGLARLCYYAGRRAGLEGRLRRALAGRAAALEVREDRSWSGYERLLTAWRQSEEVPPSFRDESPPAWPGTKRRPVEEQPWRGEELQRHVDD